MAQITTATAKTRVGLHTHTKINITNTLYFTVVTAQRK